MTTDLDEEQVDPDELETRRCRHCRRSFRVKPGQIVRTCPHCGAGQGKRPELELTSDPRIARAMGARRVSRL